MVVLLVLLVAGVLLIVRGAAGALTVTLNAS
jgi:hypothetical protein